MSKRPRENGIAPALKAHRINVGWTLAELSEKCGLSQSYLSDIERGRTIPSIDALHDIADAYGFTDVSIALRNRDRSLLLELSTQAVIVQEWITNTLTTAREMVTTLEKLDAQYRAFIDMAKGGDE